MSLEEQSIERAKSICEADGEALAKYYEGTNEYWYGFYFATRDHKLFQMMTSDWNPEDEEREQEIDLDKLSDDKVNDDADNANIEEIAEHVRMIKLLVKGLRTEKGRDKAKKNIKTLIGKEK